MTTTSSAEKPKEDAKDLFLSYNSRDRDAVQRVRQLLRIHNVSTFLDRDDLHPGRPWFDELDAALRNVSAVAVFFGANGIGTIQKREMWVALDRQAQAEKFNQIFSVIPVILPGAELDEAPSFLLLNTFIDLREPSGEPEAVVALAHAVRGLTKGLARPELFRTAICPYRGLRPFREEDAPLFFGRKTFSRQLFERTRDNPFVAVVGASGSGKSSVVQAGLLPLLRRERPPRPVWEVAIFTPGSKPFHSLAAAILTGSREGPPEPDKLSEVARLAQQLRDGSVPLARAISLNLQKSGSAERLLLIADQFEELFTLAEEPERSAFVRVLLAALDAAPVTLLITLRGDFFGEACGLDRQLSDRIQQGLVNVGPMTEDEVRQAIEQPARYAGLTLEPGLTNRLIESIKGQPGGLPLLEFALSELWERRNGSALTHDAFESIGGIEGALGLRAETQFAQLSEAEQKTALRLFSRLVRISTSPSEGIDIRQRLDMAQLDGESQAVVAHFVKARLLTASLSPATEEDTVEVTHEAILRRWERLKQYLHSDREFLLWRQRLGFQLGEWHRTGRDAGALLRGAPLTEARKWQRSRPTELNADERELLVASEREAGKSKRWLAAVAVVVLLAALGGFLYSRWTRSNPSVTTAVLADAPDLVASSAPDVARNWLVALVRAGRAEQAIEQTGEIADRENRARGLDAIAETLEQTGRHAGAQEAMTRALALGKTTPSYLWRAVPLSRLKRTDEALAIIRRSSLSVDDVLNQADYDVPQPSEAALRAVAEAGRIDEVLNIVRAIKEPYNQVPAFGAVIPSLVKAGRTAEGIDLAKLYTAGSVGEYDSYYQSTILAFVSLALSEAGKPGETASVAMMAMTVAKRMPEHDGTLSSAFAYVAMALADAGKISEANSMIDKIALAKYIDRPNAAVAAALAKAGRLEEATGKLTGNADRSRYRVNAMRSVAERLGPDQLAKRATSLLAEPADQVELLAAGASWLADNGQQNEAAKLLQQAAGVLKSIADEKARSVACGNIAEGWARTGKLYDSYQTAATCSRSDDKLRAYTAVLVRSAK